jgi:phospholipid/cholesterol/gamma-HCH transport system ATP-binding protein
VEPAAIELRDLSFAFPAGTTLAKSTPAGTTPANPVAGMDKNGESTLLRKISVRIAPGECFVLIGPSGQGKSTLLKLMAGLLSPSSGSILIEGRDLHSMSMEERESLSRTMGFLFQRNALFDSMTSGENISFPLLEVAGATEKRASDAVSHYLHAVGIGHAKDLYPDEISGGMQKRLGIARALALEPKIVFYDDPTAGLDPITSRKIVMLIKELQAKMGTTVVAVTNDMNRAHQLAGKIGMVVDGELINCGTSAQTKEHQDPRVRQFIRGSLEGPLTVRP